MILILVAAQAGEAARSASSAAVAKRFMGVTSDVRTRRDLSTIDTQCLGALAEAVQGRDAPRRAGSLRAPDVVIRVYRHSRPEPFPMIRATAIVRRPAVKAERVADSLILDHEARQRRRVALTGEGGLEFLLDLERASVIEDGDAVKLEDGRLVQIKAAPERLIAITTDNPLRLMKVAWHLGNRHVATEITTEALYIAHDHVL